MPADNAVPDSFRTRDASFKKMLYISLGIHVGIVLAVILGGYLNLRKGPMIENAIQTRLVRLGQNKPDWLPRKDVEPEPPAPREVSLKPAETVKTTPTTPPPKVTKANSQNRLDNVLKRVADWEKSTDDDYKGKGDPSGSKHGSVSDFTRQTIGMQYITDIDQHIRPHWNIPSVIPEDVRPRLVAVVVIHIAPNGRVTKTQLEKRSGNKLFDDALLKAIQVSSPLPRPPNELKDQVARDGIEITFTGRR